MKWLITALRIVWASPASLLGLALGLLGLATGGGVERRGCIIEFHGGTVTWVCRRMPLVRGASAMTLGHVVLGQTPESLEFSRDHELVHVRQYERWGPMFIPAYLFCSLRAWLRGQNPYYDNPFEREAYGYDA